MYTYEENGVTYWKVYVNLRSKETQTIREQKRVNGVESEKKAKKIELEIIQELSKKIARWTMPLRNWKPAMNRFAIEYSGRFDN